MDLLLQVILLERDKQLNHFDALDTKAGVLLAFDGVLITLTRGIQLAFQLPGIILAAASALFALAAFWPRDFPVLRPTALRKYLTYEPEKTRLRLHDTVGEMVTRGGRVLQVKARSLKIALILLLLSALVFGAGIVVSASTSDIGRSRHDNQKPAARATVPPSPSAPPGTVTPSTSTSRSG